MYCWNVPVVIPVYFSLHIHQTTCESNIGDKLAAMKKPAGVQYDRCAVSIEKHGHVMQLLSTMSRAVA